MGKLNKIRRVFFPNLNTTKHLNIEQIKKNKQFIKDIFSDITQSTSSSNDGQNNFEEKLKALNITEEQLNQKATFAKHLSYLYAGLGSALFLYSLYVIFKLFIIAGITSFIFSLLLFAYAFKENIFYFQIKNKQLRAPLKQWAKQLFSGKKSWD